MLKKDVNATMIQMLTIPMKVLFTQKKISSKSYNNIEPLIHWFIAKNQEDKLDEDTNPLTVKKIQCLLYFMQGICLALYNQTLFKDTMIIDNYPTGSEYTPDFIKMKSTDFLHDHTRELDDGTKVVMLTEVTKPKFEDKAVEKLLEVVWKNFGHESHKVLTEKIRKQKLIINSLKSTYAGYMSEYNDDNCLVEFHAIHPDDMYRYFSLHINRFVTPKQLRYLDEI